MQFLISNDHDHPFRLSIPFQILDIFHQFYQTISFSVNLNFFDKMAFSLGLSLVESDFLTKKDESSLLTYICSLHYLQNRNKTSSSMVRIFDHNHYPQEDLLHYSVTLQPTSFVRVPQYSFNLAFNGSASSNNQRFQINVKNILPNYFKKNINNSKNSVKKHLNENLNWRKILQFPINNIFKFLNFSNLKRIDSILSIYISKVKSVRHNPFPERWISNQKKLKKINWAKIKYQIEFPTIHSLISESSKLRTLDKLLKKLKKEKHRVLIFCQMTKMMNIIEDYLQFKKYKYYRLDGGSGINERRDMVNGFQNRKDIFVFLLSTRAGGLGVTLTAADDVIFYDNDWNPTMDAQAEDRAHRIGRLNDVYIHKLVTKNTIEERILRRAQQKQNVQKTVYSGEVFKANFFSSNEVVNLFFDEEELTQHKKDLKIAREKAKQSKKQNDKDLQPSNNLNGTIEIENPSK